ncbi:nitrate- and nitrite sensing domain-containing protein [Kutzneria kofuensis]|uniref:histidine kinase n=1 Tax=Kutzneria kofuensis TaxID=103725 RepID=A0A7W9KAG6_9PSEU|nr:nitrate- and nitrite sensing domain-containing protein [Kutzneria kofuensis]MBB5889007.1 signal transduction histidine kinase [Kutzneria kofuensis]
MDRADRGGVLTVRGPADEAEFDQRRHSDSDAGRAAGAGVDVNAGDDGSAGGVAAGGKSSGWRLRNWKLGRKLVVILLVPALSTLTLAGLRLSSQLDDARQYGDERQQLAVAGQAAKVVDLLQAERDSVVAYIAAGRVDQPPKFGPVDTAADALRGEQASVSGPVRDAVDNAVEQLDELSSLRNSVVTTRLPDVAALTTYTQVIDALLEIVRVAATNVSHPQLSPLDSSVQALTDAKEQLRLQSTIVVSAGLHKQFPSDLVDQLRAAQSRFAADMEDFTNAADADNRQLVQDTISGPDVDERNRVVQLALVQSGDGTGQVTVRPADVQALTTTTAALFTRVVGQIQQQADTVVRTLVRSARRDAFRDSALVLLSLLIALAITVFVARSMLVPLRVLRRSALEVARTKLPAAIERIMRDREAEGDPVEPVPVHTTEEVGQVARAFDAVQREAVRLAAEQAALRGNVNAMFVNLSRRSQALVERQIGVIDRLEQDEQDPDQLASLFELDHLATQMRRNSENLLVLAGTTLTRRVTKPVPVSDVLGAAVSEVEKYARVQVAPAPDLTIQGRAVNDITHLIAELIDNATAFSPPTSKVTVRSARMRRGEVAIEIHDRGVGMQEADLAAANARLADPGEVDVTASRQMGLYVVAQLAKRHDIKVRLRDNADIDGGVTAHVIVPATLVDVADAVPTPPAAPPTVAAAATQRTPLPEPDLPQDIVGLPKWTPGQLPPILTNPPAEPGVTESVDLFAPRRKTPPAEPEVTPASSVEPWPTPQRRFDYDDPPTERLPIYQEVLSQWFQVPTGDKASTEEQAVPTPRAEDEQTAETPAAPEPAETVEATEVPETNGNGWHSAGDDGWAAANTLLAKEPDAVTEAGLPKRVPKSQLVPGSATPRPQAVSARGAAPAMPRRSPDALRNRMSTYQHGVSLGRHSAPTSAPDEAIDAGYTQPSSFGPAPEQGKEQS